MNFFLSYLFSCVCTIAKPAHNTDCGNRDPGIEGYGKNAVLLTSKPVVTNQIRKLCILTHQ